MLPSDDVCLVCSMKSVYLFTQCERDSFETLFLFAMYEGVFLGSFLFTTASRTALGPTQPPIQWVPGALFLGLKRPGREADHSPPSSAEIKNA
jgi:hypothetical protein